MGAAAALQICQDLDTACGVPRHDLWVPEPLPVDPEDDVAADALALEQDKPPSMEEVSELLDRVVRCENQSNHQLS